MKDPGSHDIFCYYALGQDGYMLPVLECSCGFRAREANWEEAGAAMDGHLGTIGAQSNPEPPHASATSGDRT
jgi:hypothetical protein